MKSYRFWIGCVGPKAWQWYLRAPNGRFIAESFNKYATWRDAARAVRVLAGRFGTPGYRVVMEGARGEQEHLFSGGKP